MRPDDSIYRAERIRASLASDPAVSELGIEVAIVDVRILLRGTVTSERRKEHVLDHVRRLCPDLEVGDELTVEVLRAPKTEAV